jgi:hypothetical protein
METFQITTELDAKIDTIVRTTIALPAQYRGDAKNEVIANLLEAARNGKDMAKQTTTIAVKRRVFDFINAYSQFSNRSVSNNREILRRAEEETQHQRRYVSPDEMLSTSTEPNVILKNKRLMQSDYETEILRVDSDPNDSIDVSLSIQDSLASMLTNGSLSVDDMEIVTEVMMSDDHGAVALYAKEHKISVSTVNVRIGRIKKMLVTEFANAGLGGF